MCVCVYRTNLRIEDIRGGNSRGGIDSTTENFHRIRIRPRRGNYRTAALIIINITGRLDYRPIGLYRPETMTTANECARGRAHSRFRDRAFLKRVGPPVGRTLLASIESRKGGEKSSRVKNFAVKRTAKSDVRAIFLTTRRKKGAICAFYGLNGLRKSNESIALQKTIVLSNQ